MIITLLLFALLFGATVTGAIFSYFYHGEYIEIMWQIWSGAALISLAGLVVSLCYLFRKKPLPSPPALKEVDHSEFEKDLALFKKDFFKVLKAHLKVSILFWTHFYKKEKVKTFEEAKKEVFQDLKKEFPRLPWIESLLSEIQDELGKYK